MLRDQSGRTYHLCQWHLYYDLSLCMLAGCKLLQGRYRLLAVVAGCYAFCYWQWSAGKVSMRDHAGGVMAVSAKTKNAGKWQTT